MSSHLYLDASVLLRILFREKGPVPRVGGSDELYSAEIVEVEVFRAIERALFIGRIDQGEFARKCKEADRLLKSVQRIPLHSAIVQRARASFSIAVRALDSLHIGAAEWLSDELQASIQFWTHDKRQAEAALSRHLQVFGENA